MIILVETATKLLTQENLLLSTHCLRALKAIASTMVSKEEVALTAALPAIIGAYQVPDLMLSALDVTNSLSYVRIKKFMFPS